MSWSKFFCLLVFGLLVVTSFAVNSFGLVTLSDSGIVDDALGTVLSFDGDWLDLSNGTFVGSITVDGRVLDSTDFNSWDAGGGYNVTLIWNSNGNNYSVSESGLQSAVDDCGVGDKVVLPVCNITVTSSIDIPSHITIEGQGNGTILYLQSNANDSILRNKSGVQLHNVHIKNLVIDGNGQNQPYDTDWFAGDYYVGLANGISFDYCYDSSIENVIFRDTKDAGLMVYGKGANISVHNCWFYSIGKGWEGEGVGLEIFFPCGVYTQHTDNMRTTNCYFDDVHGDCIVFEGGGGGYYANKTIISDCIMHDAYAGVWLEYAQNCIVTSCIATEMNKLEAYDDDKPCGYYCLNVKNVSFVNCHAHYCGDTSGDGYSFLSGSSDGIIYDSCVSTYSYDDGFGIGANNVVITNCRVKGDAGYGVYSASTAGIVQIINNQFIETGKASVFTNPSGTNKQIISNNYIEGSNSYGIWTTCDYAVIDGNSIYNCDEYGIYLDGLKYAVVSNNVIKDITDGGDDGIICHQNWGGDAPNNITIIGNLIDNPADDGIVLVSSSENITIAFNIILNADVGILESSGNYNKIIFNVIQGCNTAVTTSGANSRVNCTGFDDWNFYDGVG